MLLRCINAVGCVKKRYATRCIQKMQAILSVLQSNRPVNHIPIINNHYLSQTIEYNLKVSVLMKGIWLVSQLKQFHMFGIRNIYHCGSMVFPGIVIRYKQGNNGYNDVNND